MARRCLSRRPALPSRGYEPRSLKVSLDRSEQQFDKDLMSDIQEVVNRYAVKVSEALCPGRQFETPQVLLPGSQFRSRVEMYSMWRDNTSNLDKLQASLEARVPQVDPPPAVVPCPGRCFQSSRQRKESCSSPLRLLWCSLGLQLRGKRTRARWWGWFGMDGTRLKKSRRRVTATWKLGT